MDDLIVLPNPDFVREEMQGMDLAVRQKGEAHFQAGKVQNLKPGEYEGEFHADVEAPKPLHVRVVVDDSGVCDEECSCPAGGDCEHVYATLKALLVAHMEGVVRSLSETPRTQDPVATRVPSVDMSQSFEEQVVAGLGRALKAKEQAMLNALSLLHARAAKTGTVTGSDLQSVGLEFRNASAWEQLKLWPTYPKTLRRFWLYIAHEMTRRRIALPAFLQPVTDFAEIEEEMRRWERAQEVNRWKSVLGNATLHVDESARDAIDLRLAFDVAGAELEGKLPGQLQFKRLSAAHIADIERRMRLGEVELLPAAEWIWTSCQPWFEEREPLKYIEEEVQLLLLRLLRTEHLRAHLVNTAGEPFVYPPEPLRWHLAEPESASGDYILSLRRADGSSPGKFTCVLGSKSPLYVTQTEVFRGPPVHKFVLHENRENPIPAAALEGQAGVMLLRSLGLEMPSRLRERVVVEKVVPRLVCELQPTYMGSRSEQCLITATALDTKGQELEVWNGQAWKRRKEPLKLKRRSTDAIVISDRSALINPNLLLAGLDAKWEGYREGFTVRVTKKFPETFAAWVKSLPPDLDVELRGELASLAKDVVAGSVKLDVTETDTDWFDLRVVLNVNDTTLTKHEIDLLLIARGSYVRLKGKGWRRLEFKLSDEDDEQLARLGLNPRDFSAEPQRLHALQLADKAAKRFLAEPQYERIERRASEIKMRVTPNLPATVRADLRPYQLDGYHFLAYLAANHFGGILADDMGLGKTLQTLTWLEHLRESTPAPGPSLVVCPKSVTDNWRAEAQRFVSNLRVAVATTSDPKAFQAQVPEADLHVINYNQMRLLGDAITKVKWLAVVLDEGQYIKNPSSMTAAVAKHLRASHRLVLSGTPIENRLMDLWSLMDFAMPGALGNRGDFGRLYDGKEDPYARKRLAARVRPFLLRRTKSQVARDLPERMEEDLFCEIEGEQKTLYRAELKRAQMMLLNIQTPQQLAEHRFHFLTSLLRLRQICCHPQLVNPESKGTSAKVEALMEQLEPLMDEGHKVLVFSQFVEMLELLRTEITIRRWPQFYLAGMTQNRGELVKQFQESEGAAVFLISLKAGGFGLNLTAASYVMLFDPWWNPAVENQAIDRTHRIGQTRNVIAYRLLIKNSIEEKIRALQRRKSALAEDVLGEERFSQSLTLDDLKYLFGGEETE